MNRAALAVTLPLRGQELRVVTAHLESLENKVMRSMQLESIFKLLLRDASGEEVDGNADCYGASILAGDMNFDDGSYEDEGVMQAGFTDCWLNLLSSGSGLVEQQTEAGLGPNRLKYPSDRGITMPCDDSFPTPTRIDRVFLGPARQTSCKWKLVPKSMERLGMEAFDEGEVIVTEGILPPAGIRCICGNMPSDADADTDPDMPDLIPVCEMIPESEQPWNRPSDHFGLVCEFEVRFISDLLTAG